MTRVVHRDNSIYTFYFTSLFFNSIFYMMMMVMRLYVHTNNIIKEYDYDNIIILAYSLHSFTDDCLACRIVGLPELRDLSGLPAARVL